MMQAPLAAGLAELAPLAILAGAGLVLFVTGSFASATRALQRPLALVAVLAAMACAWAPASSPEYDAGIRVLGDMLVVDRMSGYLDLLLSVALAGVLWMQGRDVDGHGEREPLLLLGGVGAMLLVHAGDLLVLYVGTELLGVCGCALVLSAGTRQRDPQIAWRSFLGFAVTSAMLLLGIALLYAALSTTQMGGLAGRTATVFNQWGAVQRYLGPLESGQDLPPGLVAQFRGKVVTGMAPAALFVPGLLLTLAGVLGKLTIVPFHLLRAGAIHRMPARAAAFALTVEPVAWVAVMLRVFVELFHVGRLVNEPYGWTGMIPTLAVATSCFAGLVALRERSLVRLVWLFWLSSLGNLLLGVVAAANFYGHRAMITRGVVPKFETTWAQIAGDAGVTATLLGLTGWLLAALGLLAAIAATRVERPGAARLDTWTALARSRPALALAITACLLSSIGVPPLLGFLGKWTLLRVLLEHSSLRWLALVVIANLGLALAAHLRVLAVVYARTPRAGYTLPWHPRPARLTGALGLAVVLGGVFGAPLVRLAREAGAGASLAVGHESRARWVQGERLRWARGESDERPMDSAPEGASATAE